MEMRKDGKKSKLSTALTDLDLSLRRASPDKSFIERNIAQLKANLSTEVKGLNLSPRLLYYLMLYEIVFPRLEDVTSAFNKRLDNFNYGEIRATMKKRDRRMALITAAAIDECNTPMGALLQFPQRFKKFRAISEKISYNTDPKEIRLADLNEGQKEWVQRSGCTTIEGVLDQMVCEYREMFPQLSKHIIMNQWLEKNEPHLHEFYLLGRRRYAQKGKVFPAMAERLKSLDKLVNCEVTKELIDPTTGKKTYSDPVIYEIAIKQLQCLIENDLLFTSVFSSYFYRREPGKSPGLKRKALKKAKPYIYCLKFFNIQPIDHNGIKIKSIYDLGVLLLNALADERIGDIESGEDIENVEDVGILLWNIERGKKIYSEELIDLTDKGYSARSGKLVGSKALYDELSGFRKLWKSMPKLFTVK